MSTISLHEIAGNSDPVWVVNSSQAVFGIAADVYVSIPNGRTGAITVVTVPATWLPYEMTSRCPKSAVVESSHFSDALENGLIRLISSVEASLLLARKDAASEKSRLKAEADSLKQAQASRKLGRNVVVTNPGDDPEDAAAAKPATVIRSATFDEEDAAATETDPADQLNPSFQALILTLDSLPESDAVNRLRTFEQVSLAEAQYILDNCSHARVQRMAEGVIKKLS